MVGKQVSREELYEQVWKTPVDKLAKEYSVSGRGLGKICARLNIPVPGIGYWRKLETGHAPERPPLPPAIDESQKYFAVSSTKRFKLKGAGPPVIATDSLSEPHPLIRRTEELLQRGPIPDDQQSSNPAEIPLNIRVSEKARRRSLRIADALIKTLEEKGHKVVTERYDTAAVMYGQNIAFGIHEKQNAKLVFTSYRARYPEFRREWRDGKRQKLEQLLRDILGQMDRLALFLADEHRREMEKQAAWEKETLSKKLDQDRRNRLSNELESWSIAERIRQYVSAARSNIDQVVDVSTEDWLSWCTAYADQIDPIMPAIFKLTKR